ncbi:thioredoxin domain-containing protein [Rhizobium sophorae]|uniref:Thioredoxin domain-containing protein n=1 Tax=Rhizobium sophorae TaxID=1535242 RepID=A0A7Y3WI65_9HYPH|nr:thioredoxin domain-containing protein [Rhizobium sophorae]MBX4865060.1 thioredoxin domain-containing protein [Rhizobium bangladeshense]NKK73573.1 thioredoxin domain-containing protein [Rhizobium leguminosarum bv. viciae]NNU40948.1 thioredoxin domain-containing protein [Rhizobium sophorae]
MDHILGSASAEITLVEYGSYVCPHCRADDTRGSGCFRSQGSTRL